MNSNTIKMAVLAIAFNTSLPVIGKEPSVLQYPDTRQVDQTDTYHGVEVADPYRWLEADVRNSKEVAAWTKAQNQVTRHYLDAISERPHISERLTKLWNYERYSVPSQKAGKYFYRKNSGLQNQAVLYIADNYTQEGRVLIDPNSWSEDGTISLGATWLSEEARYLAYSRRESGSDWSTIYVLETETGRLLQDKLLWTRWGNIVWSADSTGFYYTRYPEPEEGQQYQSQTINPMCYYHKLGTSQEEDQLVYRRKDQPEWSFWISRSEDDQYLVMSIRRGTDHQNQVLVRSVDAPKDSEWTPLIDDFENEFSYFGSQGKTLYFLTDLNAPTKRVITLDATKPGREYLTEIIASSEATLEDATLIDGKIITSYLKDVVSKISIHSQDGTFLHDVELPGVGSAHGFGGRQKDTETFYAFTSYATPTSIYRYDLKTGQSTQIRSPKVDFDPSQYTVRQAFYTSKDGTRVPIIVSHRKDLKLDGNRPTLLYGYGGFSISLSPYFSVEYATWMEMGGVVAIPNLRGGGE